MSGVLKLAEALPQTQLRSLGLANINLTNGGKGTIPGRFTKGDPDMSGVRKLAEALPQSKLEYLLATGSLDHPLDDDAKQIIQAAVAAAGSRVEYVLDTVMNDSAASRQIASWPGSFSMFR